jgi:hypothetical protein
MERIPILKCWSESDSPTSSQMGSPGTGHIHFHELLLFCSFFHLILMFRPSSETKSISLREGQTFIDLRRSITRSYSNQFYVFPWRGKFVPDCLPVTSRQLNLSELFELWWMKLPRNRTETIKLRMIKLNTFYYLEVYLDETIADFKRLLQENQVSLRTRF